jgi:hypothetical protein
VQRDAALRPQLGALRLALQQFVVQGECFLGLALQEMQLGHGLQNEVALLAALEGDAILAHE